MILGYIPEKKQKQTVGVEDMEFPRCIEEEVSRYSLGGLIKNNVEFSGVI